MQNKKEKNGSLGSKPRNGHYVPCEVCGTESYYKPSYYAKLSHFYCSNACRIEGGKGERFPFVCEHCGKEYTRGASYVKWQLIRGITTHCCSSSCARHAGPKGQEHYAWRGGVSRAYKYGYHSQEYKEWRTEVFSRDLHTCQICGQVGGYLHAHHIKGFSHFPETRFSTDNGITLCKHCHYEVHSKKCEKNIIAEKMQLMSSLQKEAMEDLKRKAQPTITSSSCGRKFANQEPEIDVNTQDVK